MSVQTETRADRCPTRYEATFEITGANGVSTAARLRGGPTHYTLDVDSVAVLVGFATVTAWQCRARELAGRGHVVDVVHGARHLLSLGAVSAGLRERRMTGSPYIRFGSDPGARRELADRSA